MFRTAVAFLFVASMALQGCSSNETKVYLNSRWYAYQAKREGIPYKEPITLDSGEVVVSFKPGDPGYEKRMAIVEERKRGVTNLYEVKVAEVLRDSDLELVAKIKTEELQEAYELASGDGWRNSKVSLVSVPQGRQVPRSLTIGDVLEIPNGKRFVVDTIGFKELSPIIPPETHISDNP